MLATARLSHPETKVFVTVSQPHQDRVALWGMWALTVYAVFRGVFGALSKAFWHDEMCTYILAHQPSVGALMAALRSGADSNPPAFYLIERFMSQAVPDELL